jgi:hypothetical protein
MAFQLNPMGITGPTWAGNFVQSDYRVPAVNSAVASSPVGADEFVGTWPIAVYTQPNYPTTPVPNPPFPLGNWTPIKTLQ